MGDVKALPKWAQEEMAHLQREAAHERSRRLEMERTLGSTSEEAPTAIAVGFRRAGGERLWLPPSYQQVTIKNGDFEARVGNDHDYHFMGRNTLPAFQVMCESWHGIAVIPQAANVVNIVPGRIG